ncbi:Crp/Fnr family transcriptional regulator [Microaceticoccus formicicus]|uniref:Crp/Fnr family transcriptional regulator n=1 Tax=Microaceticoccus formicicus TaxID=3118105 RepID=UPI003CCFFB27|nr:Crp/Fnr family transcriptional regulator [Peptoniphilaceae bacterium AMB_02]
MKIDILKTTPIFKGLDENEIESVLKSLKSRLVKYSKDEVIFETGSVIKEMALLLSGSIHITKLDYLGNLNIIAVIKPGDLFGESYAISIGEKLGVTALSETDSELLMIDVSSIYSEKSLGVPGFTKFSMNLMNILAHKNIIMSKKLDHLTKRSLREKIMSYLSEISIKENSLQFKIPLNRQQMADYLCVDRSALSRELMKLKAEGNLDYHKNIFTLK